ncbi:alanine--tRNA ligase-related protein [Ilumatobacter nonamiensis]|uniref:alanine--tRNA ligase-related protein n=1 Tax=Ilumatobacter nonamiensis TaxID=467093 RepID=UPI000348C50A|nr:alanine--tRNA ligase-related protein [Ilumatobacter nonamiensis]
MSWTIERIEQVFLGYMEEHGHAIIEGHSVRSPTDDVLFTTAGMHPLVPYLHGDEAHPAGKRLTDVQRCVRTTDIDEVGDDTHLTVFEMLGNWSIGDYFKETSIPQSFGLLTGEFGIDPHSLYVTVFAGDDEVPADDEAPIIWERTFREAGVDPTGRINPLGADDNWWSNGPVGLCGPDTEIFVHVGDNEAPAFADIPEFVEIWNNVFMSYDRAEDGSLTVLDQRNVDTGMGLERLAMFLNDHTSVWETDELALLLSEVASALAVDQSSLDEDGIRSLRIVTDHLRAGLAIAAAGIYPSASRQGYVLRKLIRRAVRHAELLRGTDENLADVLIECTQRVSSVMGQRWPDVAPGEGGAAARETIEKETRKFSRTLRRGVDHLTQEAEQGTVFDGDLAFTLADTLGYPVELSAEEATRIGMSIVPGWEKRYLELREEQRARSRS